MTEEPLSAMDLIVRSHKDRSSAHRVVPMQCLALGMPRTGTNSLRDALKILGLNECYHQVTLIQNPEDGAMWTQALQYRGTGKAFQRAEWDSLLGHCQAVCDVPAVHFSRELIEAYPEAKVVLTTRGFAKWHNSVSETVEKRYHSWALHLLYYIDRETRLYASVLYQGRGEMFSGDFEKNSRGVYESHNEMLRSIVPPDRLLEYHVSEGWGPLCTFLNLPVPACAFPSGNDQDSFHAACAALDRSRAVACIGKGAAKTFAVLLCVTVWQRWV